MVNCANVVAPRACRNRTQIVISTAATRPAATEALHAVYTCIESNSIMQLITGAGGNPIVEFPPTLPRHGVPDPPPHRGGGGGSGMQLMKSRSMHDWDGGRTQLQRDFEHSLLIPMPTPGERVDEREHRAEPLPGGGQEEFSREVKADGGRRTDPETGRVTDYK